MKSDINLAVAAVLGGELTAYAACRKFGIRHQSTLSRRLRRAEMRGATVETPRPICEYCGQPIARAKQSRHPNE